MTQTTSASFLPRLSPLVPSKAYALFAVPNRSEVRVAPSTTPCLLVVASSALPYLVAASRKSEPLKGASSGNTASATEVQ